MSLGPLVERDDGIRFESLGLRGPFQNCMFAFDSEYCVAHTYSYHLCIYSYNTYIVRRVCTARQGRASQSQAAV